MELHELEQVCEAGLAVVHAEVKAALILALGCDQRAEGQEGMRLRRSCPWARTEVPISFFFFFFLCSIT
jgi:hypothetical protein